MPCMYNYSCDSWVFGIKKKREKKERCAFAIIKIVLA